MKIISKYKDFYDYLWIDGDPDLVYVRKEKLCFNLVKNLIKHDFEEIGLGSTSQYINDCPGHLQFIGFTFGIYPYVYTSPAISIKMNNYSNYVKMMSFSEMQSLSTLKTNDEQTKFITKILNETFKTNDLAPKNFIFPRYFFRKSIYEDLKKFCWKEENQVIFEKLESPVFVMFIPELIHETIYEYLLKITLENKNIDKIILAKNVPIYDGIKANAITNIVFNKLAYQVTKYWFDDINNINTYSNIESFLMTSKLDPEPIISNNEKIIAHGFDLKTSFRNC